MIYDLWMLLVILNVFLPSVIRMTKGENVARHVPT